MKDRIQMTFICDQGWDDMTISGLGRHCSLCQCVVHDFTGMSTAEIMERSKSKTLCGSFSPEQLDPTLVPLRWPVSLKAAMLTAGALVGVEVSGAHARQIPDKPKTEVSSSGLDVQPVSATSAQAVNTAPPMGNDDCGVKRSPRRKRYYLTWRFPFVKRSYIRVVGRYRH